MAGILPDDVPEAAREGRREAEAAREGRREAEAAREGRREAGARGGLVRASAGMAAALGVMVVGPQVIGGPAPVVAGRAQGGRGLVGGVMLRGTGSRDVHQDAAGRAVLGSPVVMGRPAVTGSPVMLGSPVLLGRPAVTGSPVVMGAGRGSGARGAAQAEAGLQTDSPGTGLPGRAKARTATGPGRTVAPQGDAGRDLGHSGAEMVAGKAAAARESVHMLRGAAAMAVAVARALRRPAADLCPDRGESLALGVTLAPGATIGTHAGHPAGSG